MKKEEEYTWEQREKDDKYIMERMHPAVLIPGVFIGVMAVSYTHLTLPTKA